MPEQVHLFVGPTAHGIAPRELRRGRTRLLPPVRRGDVLTLVQKSTAPGVIVICDGIFQSEPAVSHAEICDALDAGWQVWGVSSLGAIRAHELRTEGMQGFGYVHAQFARFADFTDDEMCLVHVPDPPYFPVSEALVNVRYALEQQQSALSISAAAADTLLEQLARLWFVDRTEQNIRRVMVEDAGFEESSADRLLAWLKTNRVKSLDLAELMRIKPWRTSTPL